MTPRIMMSRATARAWLTGALDMQPIVATQILAATVPVCRIHGVPMYLRADIEEALEEHIAARLPHQPRGPQ